MKTQNNTTAAASTTTKPKPSKKAPAPKISPSEAITGTKRKRTPEDFLIVPLIEKNPCNPLKARHGIYELFLKPKNPISVKDFREKGGVMFDLLDAVKLGRAKIVSPESTPSPAPKRKTAPKKKAEKANA